MIANVELRRVDPSNRDYLQLADALDTYYFEVVGPIQAQYAEVNRAENFACRIVAYVGKEILGCGCWKAVDAQTGEIKRMYVLPKHRRKGVASAIIHALETDIYRSGCKRIILETARTTLESAAFYRSVGYQEAEYYGSPAGAENCRCFEK